MLRKFYRHFHKFGLCAQGASAYLAAAASQNGARLERLLPSKAMKYSTKKNLEQK